MTRFSRTAKGLTGPRGMASKMNGAERMYAAVLDARLHCGEVLWYKFEGLTIKLANDTRYTPDFVVQLADGTIECHEVKGFWRDDALVKIKVAAEMYPFRFRSFTISRTRGTVEHSY